MKTLVVQAHPLAQSFSTALLHRICQALQASGTDHDVMRLPQDEEPDLSYVNFEHMIAVSPTWWGSPPAVLLDWLQRTLSAYVDDGEPVSSSPLRSIRRLSVVTTHGSSLRINRLQGEPGRQTWSRVVTPCCHPEVQFEWISLYKIDRSTAKQRAAFLDDVSRRFTSDPVPA